MFKLIYVIFKVQWICLLEALRAVTMVYALIRANSTLSMLKPAPVVSSWTAKLTVFYVVFSIINLYPPL